MEPATTLPAWQMRNASSRSARHRARGHWPAFAQATADNDAASCVRLACQPKLRSSLKVGAPGRTRTSTTLRPPDFESGASTDSATGAWSRQYNRPVRRVNGGAGTAAGPQDGRAIVVLHERVTSGARAADAE